MSYIFVNNFILLYINVNLVNICTMTIVEEIYRIEHSFIL